MKASSPPLRTIVATRSVGKMRQDRLADARRVEGAARSRPEEGADRLVGLDLADEYHAIVLGDAEIGGLAGRLHQLPASLRARGRPACGGAGTRSPFDRSRRRPTKAGWSRRTRPCRDFPSWSASDRLSMRQGPESEATSLSDSASRSASTASMRNARSSDCTDAASEGPLKERGRPRWRFSGVSMRLLSHRSRLVQRKSFSDPRRA